MSEHPAGIISHYSLDFLQKGEQHFYIWRRKQTDGADLPQSLLIDLNDIYMPDHEIEKLLLSLEGPIDGILSIAFIHCHGRNRQEIKRRLKAVDIRLYSKTAFFTDAVQARQWLSAQTLNC